jgi:rhomboid protease GluP
MEWNYVLLWFAGSSCVITFIQAFRQSPRLVGWMGVTATISAVTAALWFVRPDIAGLVGGSLWGVFVLAPALLQRNALRLGMRQQYLIASRFAGIAGWLHPFDGMRQQARLMNALDLFEVGQTDVAIEILEKLKSAPPRIVRLAHLQIFRMRQEWRQLVEWVQRSFDERTIGRDPSLLVMYLRGLGEIGEIDQMLLALDRHRLVIEAPQHLQSRSICRLHAFAFAGQSDQVVAILRSRLSGLPQSVQQFWLATAELTGNQKESGRRRLLALEGLGLPGMAGSIANRLASPPVVGVLSDQASEILRRLDQERDQEDRYMVRLFSGRRPWGTYALILANVIMFAVEWLLGGTMDLDALFRLGAFEETAVNGGQYWRLFTANFLHMGSAHIVMNMFALFVLGPFVETAVGIAWFLPLYLLSGVGAIATVWVLEIWRMSEPGILVGASGAIMGLIGATAAILLRGWVRERARAAGRRLRLIVAVVVMQVIFDSMTPQVSGSAHLAGVVWGFALANLIPHRTSRSAHVPRVLP